jgi:DNA-binding MarR family transcriptional regulator
MTTSLDETRNTAWGVFLTTHVLVLELIERDLEAAEMPPLSWYGVLWTLERSPDYRMRLHELAQEVLLSRSNITRLLDRLEADHLICRERCSNDRRGAYAVLTEAGLSLRKQMWQVYSEGIANYFGNYLTDEEVVILITALNKVLTAIRSSRPT